MVRRYDHEVQGGTVVKPFTGVDNDGPSDAAVVRPILDSFEGVVVAHGICPRYSDIDTYHMTANAIDEALRNYVAVGGIARSWWPDSTTSAGATRSQSTRPRTAPTRWPSWCAPTRPSTTICLAYGLPLISGKDSMKNDF